ncbi:MAG: IS1634 family transposase [Nanoarchaeota archaeon]
MVANLGRLDLIGEKLGNLLKQLRKFTSEVLVTPEEIESKAALEYGPLLVGKKLWEETGLGKLLSDKFTNLKITKYGEPQVLAMVLNRMMCPSSELSMINWLDEIYLPEFENPLFGKPEEASKVRAERFYRCLDYLIREKRSIEDHLWNFTRTLLPADIIFYDITNVQFEGDGPKSARIGYARLGKRNHKQILLGLVVLGGLPVAHHVFRGNRAEKTTLDWISQTVKKRYNVNKIIYVADRGMITTSNLEAIEKRKDGYIVGIKRRHNKESEKLLEENPETFDKIKENLFAKEIRLSDVRFIVCFNPLKASEEKKKRREIIQELETDLHSLKEKVKIGQLKKVKPIIARAEEILRHKHGKRYFDYEAGVGKFEYWIDTKNIGKEEKLDGKFIVKTKEKGLLTEEVVKRYKDLADVENMFKELKDFLCVMPVYHYADRRVKAHIFVCVLALFLEKYFEQKLETAQIDISARKAIRELKKIRVVINQVGKFTLKYVTPPNDEMKKILNSVGIMELPKILSDIMPVGKSSKMAKFRSDGSSSVIL